MEAKWIYAAILGTFGSLLAVFDAATPKLEAQPVMHCILGKAGNIYALAFSPDGKRLLAGEEHDPNDQILEWDLTSKNRCRKFDSGHSGQVVSINYSQSGRLLAIGHRDGFVTVRDRKNCNLLSFKSVENLGTTLCMVSIVEKNEPSVYTVVGNNIAQRRNITIGQTNIYYIPCDGGHRIHSASVARYGTTFVCCTPKFLHIYQQGDFDSPQEIKAYNVFKKPCITHVAISDDTSQVMASMAWG